MIVGYPTPGKGKARRLLRALSDGVPRGRVMSCFPPELPPGITPAFYGVTEQTAYLWEQAKRVGRPWIYIDNAYLDPLREKYFRVTLNRLQHLGVGVSDGTRWRATGMQIRPWRTSGSHVIVCPQSDSFMQVVAKQPNWLRDTVAELAVHTDREIRIRPWNGDKTAWYRGLPDDLADCWCLVTYSSASAITAMLAGIPAIVTAEDSIARVVAETDLAKVESPCMTQDRLPWIEVVADNHWTLEEMRNGATWRAIGGCIAA